MGVSFCVVLMMVMMGFGFRAGEGEGNSGFVPWLESAWRAVYVEKRKGGTIEELIYIRKGKKREEN